MSGNIKKVIAFNYFGGKFTHLNYIYENFPDDFNHLVEPFGGSMAVSLNYSKKVIKTVNEINSDITNFFEVLRNNEPELIRLLFLTPCSKQEYNNCWLESSNKIEQARRFYVRVRQSFFGLGIQRKNKGWHMAKSQLNSQGGETVSKWNNAIKKLHDVAEVIRSNFQITNDDYFDCIKKIDNDNAFFYCDPPYHKEARASYHDYKYEFTDKDHKRLSEVLHSVQGKVMISGYECKSMDNLYSDFLKKKLPVKKNNIRSGEVQEVIWMNYNVIRKSYKEIKLF